MTEPNFVENSFLPKFGQKGLKNRVFCLCNPRTWELTHVKSWTKYLKVLLFDFPKTMQTESSNTALTIYYTNVLPPLTLYLPQYGVYTKSFLHLIVCVTSPLLLFQVIVDPCSLACLNCGGIVYIPPQY